MRNRITEKTVAWTAQCLGWIRRHAVLIATGALLATAVTPRPGNGQGFSPCCTTLAVGLGTINSTLGSVVGSGLQAINGVMADINGFEQTIVWPRQAIASALRLGVQIQGLYTQVRVIFRIPIATATLRSPQQLEGILMSRSAAQIPNTANGYQNVYGSVPLPQNAPPPVRDMIDMTDATAKDAMQRAIAIDAIADQELAAADQINGNVQTATPGTAPIIEAQADAWLIRAHAYTQSALADLMRVRAIDLANTGAGMKLGSSYASSTQQNVTGALQHK
jgi:hypothetical protein